MTAIQSGFSRHDLWASWGMWREREVIGRGRIEGKVLVTCPANGMARRCFLMTFGMMSGDMWTSAEFPMFAQRGRFFPDWHSHPISISLPMQMSDSFKALLRFVFHELMGVVAFFAFIFAHTAVEWGIHFFEVTDE